MTSPTVPRGEADYVRPRDRLPRPGAASGTTVRVSLWPDAKPGPAGILSGHGPARTAATAAPAGALDRDRLRVHGAAGAGVPRVEGCGVPAGNPAVGRCRDRRCGSSPRGLPAVLAAYRAHAGRDRRGRRHGDQLFSRSAAGGGVRDVRDSAAVRAAGRTVAARRHAAGDRGRTGRVRVHPARSLRAGDGRDRQGGRPAAGRRAPGYCRLAGRLFGAAAARAGRGPTGTGRAEGARAAGRGPPRQERGTPANLTRAA